MALEPRMRAASGGPSAPSPNIQTFNCLVRDRMPDLIESKGNIAVWKVLDDAQFDCALRDSMVRFCQRFAETQDLESLCDLLDAIDAWLALKNLTEDAVLRARNERRKRCGGFDGRRFLQAVAKGDDVDAVSPSTRFC